MAIRTLLDIRTRLRQYIGEPYASGVTSLNQYWLDTELNNDINSACRKVMEDCSTFDGYSLDTRIEQIKTFKGRRKYQLPNRLIEVQHVVVYQSGGTPFVIPQANIAGLLDGVNQTTVSDIPFGFQIQGTERFVITEGIATSGSATTLVDANRSGAVNSFDTGTAVVDDDGNALATADYVQNVTAGWEAQISAVTSTTTLTVAAHTEAGGMRGGRPNTEAGDYYRILAGEYTRPVLWIEYPRSVNDDTSMESHTTGTNADVVVGRNSSNATVLQSQGFIVDRDIELSSITVELGAKTGTPRGNMMMRVETNSSGVPSGTLVEYRAVAAISEEDLEENDDNLFSFRDPFPLRANTTYHFTLSLPAQTDYYATATSNYWAVKSDSAGGYAQGNRSEDSTGSWSAQSGSDLYFTINKAEQSETIHVHYVPSPLELTANGQMLEVPSIAEEAVYWYACMLAMEKKGDAASERKRDRAERRYKQEVENILTWVRRRSQRGYTSVQDVMFGGINIPLVPAIHPRTHVTPISYDGDIT